MSLRTEYKLLEIQIQQAFSIRNHRNRSGEWELKNLFVEERISNIMEQQQQANERNIGSWPWKAYLQKKI